MDSDNENGEEERYQCDICTAKGKCGQNRKTLCSGFALAKTPDSWPYKCPVCGGAGVVTPGFYSPGQIAFVTDTSLQTCKACNGVGVIWS